MVDSVNGVGAVSNSTFNISFEELDANKDGKVDKNDYDMLKGYITDDDETNDLKITTDDLDKIFEPVLSGEETELEDCPDCRPDGPANAEDQKTAGITAENANEKAGALLADKSRTELDPKTAKTAEELKAIQDQLTAQIAEYDAVEKVLLEKIEKLQSTLEGINKESEEEEKNYENTSDEANAKANKVNDKVETAEAKATAEAEEKKETSEKVAAQCLDEYKAGTYGDESLSSVIQRRVAEKVGDEKATAGAAELEEAKALSDEVDGLAKELNQIEGNIDELKTQAEGKNDELSVTVANRDDVLAARAADSQKFQDAYDVKVGGAEEPEPEKKGCCDPMTFTKDNIQYDFIQDRDNDGIFDDKTEFLGAENGWEEMKAYDKDGNGTIEGDELKDLKMVGVDKTSGKYTFTTAAEAGVTSIDLSTYKEDGSTKNSGDKLEGTFKVNIGGEEVAAEQTTDLDINLTNKYGEIFGKEIKDYSDNYETNPFEAKFKANMNANALAKETKDAVEDANAEVNNANAAGNEAANNASDADEPAKEDAPVENPQPTNPQDTEPKKIEE